MHKVWTLDITQLQNKVSILIVMDLATLEVVGFC